RIWHMLTPVAVLEGNQYAYRDTLAFDMLPEGWEPVKWSGPRRAGAPRLPIAETETQLLAQEHPRPRHRSAKQQAKRQDLARYCSFAYSVLACFRMGISGSASFQRARKSL